jgi:predicted dehydrogenase
VVSICAPTGLHREIGVAAAEAGKPFWIEKPVGRDAKEAADVAAAARSAGVIASVGYNYRHAPAVEHVRELVRNGDLGRITNVRAVFFNGYASEPKGALSWRFVRDLACFGALGDLLSRAVPARADQRGDCPDQHGLHRAADSAHGLWNPLRRH